MGRGGRGTFSRAEKFGNDDHILLSTGRVGVFQAGGNVIETDAKLRSSSRCLLTELENQTGVLLHLDTKFYFTLNDTGLFVWRLLAQGGFTAVDLATRMSEEFEVSAEAALSDLRGLLTELEANRLVERG